MLTQNTPFCASTGLVWLRRLRHISSVGGGSDTEQTAVAVTPVLPPGPAVVMTWTAAPSRLIASRNAAGSTLASPAPAPTAAKAPSMASSGRWSIQLIAANPVGQILLLMGEILLRRALPRGTPG